MLQSLNIGSPEESKDSLVQDIDRPEFSPRKKAATKDGISTGSQSSCCFEPPRSNSLATDPTSNDNVRQANGDFRASNIVFKEVGRSSITLRRSTRLTSRSDCKRELQNMSDAMEADTKHHRFNTQQPLRPNKSPWSADDERRLKYELPHIPLQDNRSKTGKIRLLKRSSRPTSFPSAILNEPAAPMLDPAGKAKEIYDIIMQPEIRLISQEQLVAEVRGIYGGLVMVEAKCIEVDNKQATLGHIDGPQSKLNNEEWQALIALHRTLLHEHHDFLLASQHPSASPALRRLASKYAMPARMWRHGIQ